jgi:hypothetical protein
LEIATSIREVLFALVEKLDQALTEQKGIEKAISRLTEPKQQNS